MNNDMEKEYQGATITDLIARSENDGSQFFRGDSSKQVDGEKEETNDKKRDTDDNTAAPVNVAPVNIDSAGDESRKVFVKDRLRAKNMLVAGSSLDSKFSDDYRRIKRPLLANTFGHSAALLERGNLILVTSSIPGEGKTYTAVNLALSIAHERDHTVLLVDCDVTRHGTSEILGISDRPGLVEILEDDSFTIGDAILRTDVPELCLVSAGKQHEFVTELLASQKMSALIAELGERYSDRVIILDGPPLLSTPQTRILTALVGQVVFVVEAGRTPQALVEEALDMIPEEQATGLVMNKSEGNSSRNGYYYGYYGSE